MWKSFHNKIIESPVSIKMTQNVCVDLSSTFRVSINLFIDKTAERIVMLVQMTTTVELWWLNSMLMWNLNFPECLLNVINSLSGPVPVPNWSIQEQQHQLNYDVSPCYSQWTIYWAEDHIFRLNWAMNYHHYHPRHINNSQFPPLHESI